MGSITLITASGFGAVRTIVGPTLEILLTWLLIALVLLGCGPLVRRALVDRRRNAARDVAMSDVWIGLVALVVYLQARNRFHTCR